MNYDAICFGCMHEIGAGKTVCPHCGFNNFNYVPPTYALRPSTILQGKYLIGKILGAGGFGITYLAFDMNLEHVVAIKEYYVRNIMYRDGSTTTIVTVPTLSVQQEKVYRANKERFTKEARMLAKLENLPGIVRVYDYFEENSTAYIVMEYLSGQTLKEYVKTKGGRLTWDETIRVMWPIMKSLQKLHEKNIIHRDISPDNMMFSENGDLRLVDFGGAKQDVSEAGDQRSVVIMAKKGYSPVEQLVSDKKQGPWTDEYALAATIYYCICGQTPTDAMERLTGSKLVSVRSYGVILPGNKEKVLNKALSLMPEDRYPSIMEFMSAIDRSGSSSAMQNDKTVPMHSE